MKNKILVGVAIVAALVVGLVIGKLTSSKSGILGAIESAPTYLNSSVTRQNDTYMYGDLEVKGATYFRSMASFVAPAQFTGGDITAGRIHPGGPIGALTGLVTSTMTAANFCDNSLMTLSSVTTTPTLTLPSTTTLFADCLIVDGRSLDTIVMPITTSTIFAAGTGGTLLNSSSNTVAAGKAALIKIIRDSATTYKAFIVNLPN
jgi:hypothetical protein